MFTEFILMVMSDALPGNLKQQLKGQASRWGFCRREVSEAVGQYRDPDDALSSPYDAQDESFIRRLFRATGRNCQPEDYYKRSQFVERPTTSKRSAFIAVAHEVEHKRARRTAKLANA